MGEFQGGRFVDGELGTAGPELAGENVAVGDLVAYFGVEVGAEQAFVFEGELLRFGKLFEPAIGPDTRLRSR